MCNRLRNNREACVKTRLALNLRRYGATLGRKEAANLPWAPTTFVLHAGRHTEELDAFRKHARSFRGPWIVKPGASNRGRGIAIFRTAGAVEKHLAKQRRDDAFVAQAYLANPLLVRGRKFDVRVFALVAPDGGAYVYGDGYVRTCTTPYTVEDLADLSAHLTNDAVQRSLKGYGKHEDCNKLSFAEFQRALDAERLERPEPDRSRRIDFANNVWPEIERVTACALGATLGMRDSSGRGRPRRASESKPRPAGRDVRGVRFGFHVGARRVAGADRNKHLPGAVSARRGVADHASQDDGGGVSPDPRLRVPGPSRTRARRVRGKPTRSAAAVQETRRCRRPRRRFPARGPRARAPPSPSKPPGPRAARAATRAETRAECFGKGNGSDPAA